MTFFVARCLWREDGSYAGPGSLPDAWSLLDEEFETRAEAQQAAREDRLQQMQQRGGWMGIHRIGLKHLAHRIIEAPDFDLALDRARRELDPGDVIAGAGDAAHSS